MDPLTQGLLGASVGLGAYGPVLGRRAVVWGALVGMAPDLDVLVSPASPTADWLWHRGPTHALAFGPLVGPAVAWLLWKRLGGRLGHWVGLCVAALFTHPLLDLFTSDGTQLLWPFSRRRLALDAGGSGGVEGVRVPGPAAAAAAACRGSRTTLPVTATEFEACPRRSSGARTTRRRAPGRRVDEPVPSPRAGPWPRPRASIRAIRAFSRRGGPMPKKLPPLSRARPVVASLAGLLVIAAPLARAEQRGFEVVVRGGTVYDGSGGPPRLADVGLRGDRVEAVGDLARADARTVLDAAGLAVAPGFVNMLSWATDDLLADPRSQSDIRQGVTTEIFGEGESYGPWSEPMKVRRRAMQGDFKYEITWTTLAEYLQLLERRGLAPNVASFVGSGTIREHVVGLDDGRPTPAQLGAMRELVRRAMEDGALGVGSALIYAPDSFNSSEDLVELARVAARHGGRYITHMRSEGDRLLEAVDETIALSRAAGIPAEIYHLKAAGEANWPKLDRVIQKVEAARREGLKVTADMYTYTAGATGFDACLPPWSREGGWGRTFERIRDGETRARMLREMRAPGIGWENVCQLTGSPERILLVAFRNESLKPLTGKTLAEVASARGRSPEDTILDLVVEDESRIGVVFFMISEGNVRRQVQLPWVSFGSDAGSMAPEGVFLKSSTHPRAYGNFARLLGRYVREEKLVPLEEAIRRLTSFPAENLGLERRGRLAPGYFADVVVFDPATIADRATYENPHQYAVGVRHVLVNGVPVLRDGEHTGALPGRALMHRGAPGGPWLSSQGKRDGPPVGGPARPPTKSSR